MPQLEKWRLRQICEQTKSLSTLWVCKLLATQCASVLHLDLYAWDWTILNVLICRQVSAIVYDSANPDQKAQANLTITVERNENRPRFTPGDYSTELLEIEPVGSNILQVKATDEDGVGIKLKSNSKSSSLESLDQYLAVRLTKNEQMNANSPIYCCFEGSCEVSAGGVTRRRGTRVLLHQPRQGRRSSGEATQRNISDRFQGDFLASFSKLVHYSLPSERILDSLPSETILACQAKDKNKNYIIGVPLLCDQGPIYRERDDATWLHLALNWVSSVCFSMETSRETP